MSAQPAADPPPEPERYEWRSQRDTNCDVLAVLVSAMALDFDAAVSVLETLDDEQTTVLVWCLARWFADSLAEDFADPFGMLRGLALVLAKDRGTAA